MSGKLAINGGKQAVRKGLIKPWPPIGALDRKMVLASLYGGKHAYGPNCVEFEKEFAAWNDNQYAICTNSGTAVKAVARAFEKVFTQLDQLDVEKILEINRPLR